MVICGVICGVMNGFKAFEQKSKLTLFLLQKLEEMKILLFLQFTMSLVHITRISRIIYTIKSYKYEFM